MTGAALALALALLVAPSSTRHRLEAQRPAAPARRGFTMAACVAGAVALPLLVPPTAVAAGGFVVVTLAVRWRRRVRHLRRTEESAALQGALDVLVSELRIGAHPVAAFDMAAAEVDGAVAADLRAVASRARLGADVASGLRSVAAGSPLPARWERLAVTWQLASTHGLPIASVMHTAQRDIVERERFSARVDAGLAGARATAAVLAGLPMLGVGLGQLIGADPLRLLLSGGLGGWLLLIGVTLNCCGLWWSDRITGRVLI